MILIFISQDVRTSKFSSIIESYPFFLKRSFSIIRVGPSVRMFGTDNYNRKFIHVRIVLLICSHMPDI